MSAARLRSQLAFLAPVLWDRFRLHPWDLDRLSVREVASYLDVLAFEAEQAERDAADPSQAAESGAAA